MSEHPEHLIKGPEQHELIAAHVEDEPKGPEAAPESSASFEHEHQNRIEEIQQSIEQHAISGKEVNITEQEDAPSDRPAFITRELKMLALRRNLNRVRKHLSKPQQLASKVIHQPVVSKVSEMAEDTVARPSGLLGGGIIALAGSFTLLYMAKHYGFEYNFLAFFLLFTGGFLIGILAEVGMKLIKR